MGNSYWSLEEFAHQLHEKFNQKFAGRTIPSESVTEPFISRVVGTIMEDFYERGKIPFIPEFRIMNQSSLNEHFEGSVPDFSKHVNLIGLSGDTPPGEPGIMNVAITGEDAREYARQISDPTGPASAESASSDHQPENPPEPPEDIDPEDAREQLRLIKGGKNN